MLSFVSARLFIREASNKTILLQSEDGTDTNAEKVKIKDKPSLVTNNLIKYKRLLSTIRTEKASQ